MYINGFILLVDTTPITCPPQPPQQSQMSRPMAQPKRGRPPKHTQNNNDLMTDGEGQLPTIFSHDVYGNIQGMAQHQHFMMMPQDNKQQMFVNPNCQIPFQQFTTSSSHMPLQQLQRRGSPSLIPRGTVIRALPSNGLYGDSRQGYDETDSVPSKPIEGCFPPPDIYSGHGFIKSYSDSRLCGKDMDYQHEGLERIAPFECQMPPDNVMSDILTKQIKTEDLGFDIFQKDEERDVVEEEKSVNTMPHEEVPLPDSKTENVEDIEMTSNDQNKQILDNENQMSQRLQDLSGRFIKITGK